MSPSGLILLTLLALLLAPMAARAQAGELLADLLGPPGSAGLGGVNLIGRSPYRGGGTLSDFQPLYLYEGEQLFLRSDRIGLNFRPTAQPGIGPRLEVFLRRRVDGHPPNERLPALAGMAQRESGLDLAVALRGGGDWGQAYAVLAHDLGRASDGAEVSLGLHTRRERGRWTLRPALGLVWSSSQLNDYRYGVRPEEATVERPAYRAGPGWEAWAGLFAEYAAGHDWRVFGGFLLHRLASTVSDSPIVASRLQPMLALGAVYGFGQGAVDWSRPDSPTYVRLMHGAATEDGCHLARILTLRCADLNSEFPTRVTGLAIGKPFVERFRGLPLDFVGFVGLMHHHDRPFQRNGVQVALYMKAYYDGFPWRDRLMTRAGFGIGLSVADPVPYEEVISQAARDRPTSRVLNYLDPSIDVSLGDLVGHRPWRHTYIGLGVSHRSGIFAWSRLLGRVHGGSNYIHLYLETRL